MKTVLSIQDISCFGKCSQTIALPVLSAMGIETAVLPTALLSTHTLYPSPVRYPLTDQLLPIARHWASLGITFDAICVGYLGSAREVALVREICAMFREQASFLLVDPVMGDHGRLYSGFDDSYVEALASLCADADVLIPNLTEACLLTGTPYPAQSDAQADPAFRSRLLEQLRSLCPGLCAITGIQTEEGLTGFCAADSSAAPFLYQTARIPASYHGSGDLFAAVTTGALLSGLKPEAALRLAADHTRETIRVTESLHRDPRLGLAFEETLPALMQGLQTHKDSCPA